MDGSFVTLDARTAAMSRTFLSRNLAALRQRRPRVHAALSQAGVDGRYLPILSPTGAMTIVARQEGQLVPLIPGAANPQAWVREVMRQLAAPLASGRPIALCGMGDGHLLSAMAMNPPQLFMDMQLPIYLLEPDPSLVIACLMIHDYTGPQGPIEQERTQWFVGADCGDQFERRMMSDSFLPYPVLSIPQGLDRGIGQRLQTVLQKRAARDARYAAQVEAYYATDRREELVQLFGDNPPRMPRVMLITTRFSTVLQYSTRDAAEAFTRLGWETHLLIEPSSHHRIDKMLMRQTVAAFRPDMVFQIDHLRQETRDVFPRNLPFVCWIQDNLSNLTNRSAGEGVGRRDFVLAPSAQRYVTNYAYPARQCLEFRKLTHVPARPAKWTSDGDDLVYVSNWSQPPQAMAKETLRSMPPEAPRPLMEACIARMLSIHDAGGSLASPGEVRRLLEETMESFEAGPIRPDIKLGIVTALHERLNIGLYRQQGLRWAMKAAKELGLTLGIYGNGWESNPEFAGHARGPVSYGKDLEALTRRSKINLVLEPYVSIAHQRLLDGLAAGGFFLLRGHVYNDLFAGLLECLAGAPDEHRSFEQAMRTLDPGMRRRMTELKAACDRHDASPGEIDAVGTIRALESGGYVRSGEAMLPKLSLITFDSPEALRERVRHFLENGDERGVIAAAQREVVENRFSYEAGMKTMIGWMRDVIERENIAAVPLAA